MPLDASTISRSGLTLGERNAVQLYAKRAYDDAAKALGWTSHRAVELGPSKDFIEKEIGRIRSKVKALAERKPADPPPSQPKPKRRVVSPETTIEETAGAEEGHRKSTFEEGMLERLEGRLAEIDVALAPVQPLIEERDRLRVVRAAFDEKPERLDEREAQPLPPPAEKLDEREPQPPPTPSPPPVREDQPDDSAEELLPTVEECRDWVLANHKDGEPFQAADLRRKFPILNGYREVATARLNELIRLCIVVKEGERGGTRYRYNTGPRPGEATSPTRNGSAREVERHGGRGRPVGGTGRGISAGSVGREPAR